MTGDRQHKDHTSTGHLSRHSNRPNVFYFFPTAHFLKTILANPQVAHLALPHPQADPSQNQKSHFFAYAPTEIRILVNYILTIKE